MSHVNEQRSEDVELVESLQEKAEAHEITVMQGS
jgi:hypothetical protein